MTEPSDTPTWSVEHYGFAEPAPTTGPTPPPTPPTTRATAAAPPTAGPAGRRTARFRVLLVSAALALGLTAGGAGFVAAQASGGGDGGPPGDATTQPVGEHGHQGHGGQGDGRR